MAFVRTALWLACFIAAFTATHRPPSDEPHGFRINDKVLHATGFALLTVATVWRFGGSSRGRHTMRIPMIIAFLAAYGAIDELTQPPFARTADVWDWTADLVGIPVGLFVAHMALKRRSIADGRDVTI
jgi:VanZ family protein